MAGFGEFVRKKRLARKIPFSEFCRRVDLEPVGWRRIERGRSPSPAPEQTRRLAGVLGLQDGGAEWDELFELARRDAAIAPGPLTDAGVRAHLPVLFRTHPEEPRHGGDDTQDLLDDMKDLLKKAL